MKTKDIELSSILFWVMVEAFSIGLILMPFATLPALGSLTMSGIFAILSAIFTYC